MNRPTIRPAWEFHAYDLHRRLRASDLRELQASTDEEPLDILLSAIRISDVAWAAERNGHCQVLFGVAPIIPEAMGSIWLLASDDIYKWRKDFMRLSREYVARMHRGYPVLTNFVDDRNTASQAWLRRLGFQSGKHDPHYGVERRPFTQFTSVRT